MTDDDLRPETGQIITVKQAAEMLKVSGMTIRRLIDTGRLPAWRVAGDGPIRIGRSDVEALRVPVFTPDDEREVQQ
jgi:excisionase family DNA binding protein